MLRQHSVRDPTAAATRELRSRNLYNQFSLFSSSERKERFVVSLQLERRNLFLSALVVIIMLASALALAAPKASAVTNDCPAGKICLWAGQTFGGQQSFWNASETGCHALASIDPQSVRNNTGSGYATFPGWGMVAPGVELQRGNPYTGELCIS